MVSHADAAALLEEHRARILMCVPGVSVSLSGSASVEELAATDVDLVALVSDVVGAAVRLHNVYPAVYENDWRDDWVAFRDPGRPQVDLVVTRAGTTGDAHHRRAWELLANDEGLLVEYRALKAIAGDYERRKAKFFERVVSLLAENSEGARLAEP